MIELLSRRAAASSVCPSEVARAVDADDWRALMPRVRRNAARLAITKRVSATRGDATVDPLAPGGPIRLRRGPAFEPV